MYQNRCVNSEKSNYSGPMNGTIHVVAGGEGSHLSEFSELKTSIEDQNNLIVLVESGRCLHCRWILKTDYTSDSNKAKFLAKEPYEWYKSGLSKDGAINLETPGNWHLKGDFVYSY
ncbi:hypothetical protein POM88_008119 [Heracleum sosnowskyi]|uniref:Uncharacterized protein n=1 Tax=Heracleum sosnowskyi TaxID=360622 RepID=A0AAD8J6U3_9APIA|nr:hypothetical protein POM88_008119 [Heracleum sosnowskyi]